MTNFLTLQSVDAILALASEFSPLGKERIPLENAYGRVLAEDFTSPSDLPGFDRSTMDGFAVRARDVFGASEGSPAFLEYVGECPMGRTPETGIKPGQCMRIWTGSMLPQGADAVVMLEYSRPAGQGHFELTRPVSPFENVILADEDAACGQVLIPAGSPLRPQEVGLLAALGEVNVAVRKRPWVAIISSGDEVVPAGETPGPAQVRDVNSYSLAALVTAAGAEPLYFGIVGDDLDKLRERVLAALDQADVLLISGGSSAGQRDYTVHTLSSLPGCELLAHGVAISPGKPLIMARLGEKSLWGLPGHVASALVCAEVFIRPLLRRLLGQSDSPAEAARRSWEGSLRAKLTRSVASAPGRREYVRVALSRPDKADETDAPLLARPITGKSGLISTLVEAQALVICPEDQEGLAAGQIVDIHLLL